MNLLLLLLVLVLVINVPAAQSKCLGCGKKAQEPLSVHWDLIRTTEGNRFPIAALPVTVRFCWYNILHCFELTLFSNRDILQEGTLKPYVMIRPCGFPLINFWTQWREANNRITREVRPCDI
jgi:hypothetical protein